MRTGRMVTRHAPAGPVVAIETSGRLGSVAVAVGGTVAARCFLTERAGHASGLVPAVRQALAEAGASLEQVEGVVVGAGPGSFTGVRIAGAAAKGLASGLAVHLYTTSSLRAASFAAEAFTGSPRVLEDAVVAAGIGFGAGAQADGEEAVEPASRGDREIRYVLFDARNGRVYGACYDVGAHGPVEVKAPHGGSILDVLKARPPLGTCFVGDGAMAHASLIHAAGYETRLPPAGIPLADAVVTCCRWESVDVAGWQPDYVREWRPG